MGVVAANYDLAIGLNRDRLGASISEPMSVRTIPLALKLEARSPGAAETARGVSDRTPASRAMIGT